MSILWQKTSGQDRYQVRRAGNSLRLYRNGVFHTQYNPHHPISGNLWDLLLIPAFFFNPVTIRRVLVLGVGGGAVIRLLNQFVRPEEVIGVELNPLQIHIARRFFGIGRHQARLVRGDAVQWIKDYRGPPFDMIVDDLFGEVLGQPERAVSADSDWFIRLRNHLSTRGVLVMNFASRMELKACAYCCNRDVQKRFASAFRLCKPQYENAIAAFLTETSTSRKLRRNLAREPGLNPAVKRNRLDYRIRRISGTCG
jgi:spermidine synthase